ncbi:group 1 truncated hemoglobin [Idiomarina tyrosinivorans]|uniref:Group 1 truncated hemoglobin n=1 Tax=Idiomarina tyrosinivorans TaxID=1445662 RepID=A0A432ZRD9_9GAMM|nr:group 1 truncated hemoglobin [Idiomarina tyrosinivorans]RUO80470.1 group 1 truncated hemoglobin [Idiomarina tyrosinivorans]
MKSIIVALALLFSVTAGAAQQSLYQQFGGKQGIADITEEMLFQVGGDERIAHHFEDVDIVRLHRLLTEQICQVVGGPCEYTGDTMKASHRNLGISTGDFNVLVEHLIRAMEKFDIPTSAQNQLLAKLAAMHNDVVEE